MCPPSLGTGVPTVRTPDWSRPMGFYPSLLGYNTPKCATYVCMCLTSRPGVDPGDQASLMSDQRSYSGTITTPMAPNFSAGAYPLGRWQKPYLLGGGVAKCSKGIPKARLRAKN